MYEKRLKAVPSQSFTSNGTTDGQITVADASLFKVKQQIILSATSLSNRDDLEVKRVLNRTTLFVGPKISNIDSRADISAFTIALSAVIFANEQQRPKIPEQEIERHTYEEEPVVARRTFLVDDLGDEISVIRDINGVNRLAVDADITVDGNDLLVDIDYPNTIVVNNISVVTANTEMTHVLAVGAERYVIKVRNGAATLNIATITGAVTTSPYFKVNRGVVFDSGLMNFAPGYTIYFSASASGVIVEIITWLA